MSQHDPNDTGPEISGTVVLVGLNAALAIAVAIAIFNIGYGTTPPNSASGIDPQETTSAESEAESVIGTGMVSSEESLQGAQ
ncbi:hypothetical protein [Fulvimarina sp. MAC3]|uniref:hypothetical protein n=1 Tax=Fulvimarina sp. MAC3 TaxID=3148887 RepID=UPI0031FD9627